MVGGLVLLQEAFELGIGGEVDSLVRALPEGGKGDAAVEGTDAFFFDDGIGSVGGITIFWDVEGVGH